MEITSLTNDKVKQWVRLQDKKQRDKQQLFLVEGEHLVEEAMRFNLIEYLIVEIGFAYDCKDYQTYYVSSEIMKKISASVSGSKVIACCHFMQSNDNMHNKVIALDGVQDPGNLGMIIRSAIAFGYRDIILSNASVDIYNDKVIRSTQGALFQMNVVRGNIKDILLSKQEEGYHVYGTALKNAKSLQQVTKQDKHILVFGHEGKGISKEILALTNTNIFIEMENFESLNVAAAASICMYEMSIK